MSTVRNVLRLWRKLDEHRRAVPPNATLPESGYMLCGSDESPVIHHEPVFRVKRGKRRKRKRHRLAGREIR